MITEQVPAVCVLDPDGDIVRYLDRLGKTRKHRAWPCFHSELYIVVEQHDLPAIGIVPGAVGAPYAVVVSEQLFASGCQLLISISSAGSLQQLTSKMSYILIDKALRDEGVSYHYQPVKSGDLLCGYSHIDNKIKSLCMEELKFHSIPVNQGGSWTTDAPYRETPAAIAAARNKGLIAVEMESSALYALGQARNKNVICFAQLTNSMATDDGDDFEKGGSDGAVFALSIIKTVCTALSGHLKP